MPRILVYFDGTETRDYETQLKAGCPGAEIVAVRTLEACAAEIGRADILFAFGAQLRGHDLFTQAPGLRWVQAMGTGMDGILDQPGLRPETVVTATRGIHGPTLSEMGIMLMLALARDLPRSLRLQQEARWERWPARLLRDKTVGILGVGQISEVLAPMCKAFGMQVVGFTRTARPAAGFDRMASRDALLTEVGALDFLVLLIPATEETNNIVSAEVIAAMKPTAYLVNLARGSVVDEAALITALNERRIGGAGLDTFQQEPLPPDHPVWKCPNTIVTSHLAGYNDTYTDEASAQFIHNYKCFMTGRVQEMTHLERSGVLAGV